MKARRSSFLVIALLLLTVLTVLGAFTISHKTFGTSVDTAFPANVTPGNLIIVGVTIYDPVTVFTVTGVTCGPDTLTQATGAAASQSAIANSDIWYKLSATGGTTQSCHATFSGSPGGYNLMLYEYNHSGSVTFDSTSGAADSGNTNATSLSITAAAAGELLFSVVHSTLGMSGGPSGWVDWQETPVTAYYGDAAGKHSGSSGANAVAWPFLGSMAYAASGAAFSDSGGGGLTPAQKARGFFHLPN